MPGGVTWKCKEIELDELANDVDQNYHEKVSWHDLLALYTEKSLTYPSDRLHALRGVIAELQQMRDDTYYFDYGVWHDSLFQDVLWRRYGPISMQESLHLPTWSWATTGCSKIWYTDPDTECKNLTDVLKITTHGRLDLKGLLSRSVLYFHPDVRLLFDIDRQFDELAAGNYDMDKEFLILAGKAEASDNVYLLWDRSKEESCREIGLAMFDTQEPVRHARCFFVTSTNRPTARKW